jgi:hypothetical protein
VTRIVFSFKDKSDFVELGEGEIESAFVHGQLRAPLGFAFVCTRCGDTWAKANVDDQNYIIYARTCPNHNLPFYFDFPGSVWLDWDKPYQLSFPLAVLLREVLVHIKHWEAFQKERVDGTLVEDAQAS